jgi:polar amino acid transport system permease protein
MWELLVEQVPRFFTAANLAFLAGAATTTLLLAVVGCGIGVVGGFALAVVRTTRSRGFAPLRWIAIAYVELFRRIPFLVVLLIVLFLAQAVSPTMSLFMIALIAISLMATAYLAEIMRAGFEAVPRQQIEAAETMNFPRSLIIGSVILPQAWRVIVPPAIAFMVMFLKDTALASQMGVIELTFAAKTLNNRGFSSFLVFGTVLVIYIALSWPLARLGRWLEIRLAPARSR